LSKKWQTDNEPELADRLNNSPPLKKSIKQLPLQRHTTAGSIQLDWTVQIRALGDRTSHVIMQVGAGAFGDPYGAKLGACLSVANALTPLLTPEVVPEQGFWIEPAFWRLAFGDGLLGS
jgi:hypothetical protein